MLITTRAPSMRRMSSASSSAPRAVKTCVSPIFLQRSCAGVPLKTDGKSSGMVIVTGDLRSALIERSEEHTSELQSQSNLVCRLLLEKKKNKREKKSERLALRIVPYLSIS